MIIADPTVTSVASPPDTIVATAVSDELQVTVEVKI
jgi:hypothetical protein